jgi:hypothetical protein
MVLFFLELSSRRVQIAGISASTNGFWMNQTRESRLRHGLLVAVRQWQSGGRLYDVV